MDLPHGANLSPREGYTPHTIISGGLMDLPPGANLSPPNGQMTRPSARGGLMDLPRGANLSPRKGYTPYKLQFPANMLMLCSLDETPSKDSMRGMLSF